MSQSAKGNGPQGVIATARRARVGAAGDTVFKETATGFVRAGFADPTLVLRWPEIAGEDVARIAQPVRLQEDGNGLVLTLRCEAGVSVFLQHQTRSIVERLNAYFGAGRIARIRLVTGAVEASDELPPHPLRDMKGQAPTEKPENLTAALERLGQLRKTLPK